MDEKFVRDRITKLRITAGKSEREMSLDLGHSGSYINSISSGRTSPSMKEFLYICEYLEITPALFFDEDTEIPPLKRKVISQIDQLDDNNLELLTLLIPRLKNETLPES